MELVTSRRSDGSLPFPAMRTSEDPLSAEKFKIGLLTHLWSLLDRARANTQRSAESYKKYHDRVVKPPLNVRVGDQAYIQRPLVMYWYRRSASGTRSVASYFKRLSVHARSRSYATK